jgi:chemotaxis protein MotA
MFVIIGWVVALGCVFGVYIVHGGNIGVILKALPFEMITIFGAAIGAFLANNQMKVVKASIKGLGRASRAASSARRATWSCWRCCTTSCRRRARKA